MDWQSGLAHDSSLYENHVIPAADFLVANGPSDGVERWEEQSGYSPSTIAAEIAGLTAAAAIARVNHDWPHAAIYQATADDFARNIENWTVTTTGPYISSACRATSSASPSLRRRPDYPTCRRHYSLNNGNMHPGRPALGDRRRLPRSGPARGAPGERSGCAELAQGGRRHDRAPDPERPRLLPVRLQLSGVRRRLRRLLRAPGSAPESDRVPADRRAVAAHRHRHRAPVAGAERGAGRVRDRRRRLRLRRRAAERDAEDDVGSGARARAGLGRPGRACLGVRLRSCHGLDRLHQRQARRLGQPADLGPGRLCPPGDRSQRRARPRDPEDRVTTATSATGCPARCR